MFNNDDNKDYTPYGEYGGSDNKDRATDVPKSVLSYDEYGLPVREEKKDDYSPAYVDNTYTNSFGNSFASALAGMDKKQDGEKKAETKPHTEEKRYLGTSSFGFIKRPESVSRDNHIFNKPKENKTDDNRNAQSRFGAFGASERVRSEQNNAQPSAQQVFSNVQPAQKRSEITQPTSAYSQPAEVWPQPTEQKSVYGQSANGYTQDGYAQGGYSQSQQPNPPYSQTIESKPVYTQSRPENEWPERAQQTSAYSQPAQVWSQPTEQNSAYGQSANNYTQNGYGQSANGYGQSADYANSEYAQSQRGYYDGYAQGTSNYTEDAYNGYSYAQDAYGAQQDINASDSAPEQRPLSKEEIKRQQKHDALLQKEQERQQKQQAKLDKLNQKEQERRQKVADKQAQLEEKERQKQQAVALKRQQEDEAAALKQQKEQEALALKQQKLQQAEDKKLADKQAKEDSKRKAKEEKEQAKLDKQSKKEQAKLDKEQAKFDKQNKKEEAKQAKLDKKQQAIADKQQAKLDKQSKKSKTAEAQSEGFADMTEYSEEKKRVPEENDMLGGDFVNAVYSGGAVSSADAASAQSAPAQPTQEQPYVPRYVSSDQQTVLVTLPDKEQMTRKQRKIAKKASRFDEMDLRNYPMTVGKWLATFIILILPGINVLASICWFFGVGNKSRTAFIRCFFVIGLILLIVLIAAMGVGYYFLAQKAEQEVGAESVNEKLIYGVDYVCDALGGVIGEDKILPIRNAIVGMLGGQEKQVSSGDTQGA